MLALRRRLTAQHAALASAMACFLFHASSVDTLDELIVHRLLYRFQCYGML